MSSEVSIKISFPLGARFTRNPEIIFYGGYISFLKGLFCVNTEKACHTCPMNGTCRYFRMTGNNFTGFPGILMRSSYFTKLRYEKNEELEFKLFYVGNNDSFAESAVLFLNERLNQKLAGTFFCIKEYQIVQVVEQALNASKLIFNSPVQSENIAMLADEQIRFYNENYQTMYKKPLINTETSSLKFQKRSGYRIGGKYIPLNGYIGEVTGQINGIPPFLSEYGIGKNNCVGGGQFEAQNITS